MNGKLKYPLAKKMLSTQSLISFIVSIFITIATSCFDNTIILENGVIHVDAFLSSTLLAVIVYIITFLVTELYEYTEIIYKNRLYIDFYENFYNEGIEDFYSEYTKIDIKGNLANTKKVCFLEIYSSKIFTQNIDEFKEFLTTKTNSLEVVLLDSDTDSNQYKYLTEKFGYEKDKIKNSTADFVKELKSLKKQLGPDSGEICVYYSKYIPQHSLIIFDNIIYCTFYKTSPGRSVKIPVFRIKRKPSSTFYGFLEDDFDWVKKNSRKEVISET